MYGLNAAIEILEPHLLPGFHIQRQDGQSGLGAIEEFEID
jgi:hypothetical protein